MIFEKYLMPDKYFDTFDKLTPEMIKNEGYKLIVCDVDNTLAPYEILDPPETVISWVKDNKSNGVEIVFVSNNNGERVKRFNEPLGLKVYNNAKKPSPKMIIKAMNECNVTRDETLILGDQLLTDVWAAKRAGCKAYIVPPIKDKTTLFFKTKRLIEKPYMKKFFKKNGGSND